MRHIPDASARSLVCFVEESVEPGSVVHTDGWLGYEPLQARGYIHQITFLREQQKSPSELLPRVHRVDLVAEAMVARHPSGCDRPRSPGRLPRRVHLSIQPSHVCLARQTVLSPGPAGCAGRPGPLCNPRQTTTYCVWWRKVNTPIPVIGINISRKKGPQETLVYSLVERTAAHVGMKERSARSRPVLRRVRWPGVLTTHSGDGKDRQTSGANRRYIA